MDAKMTWEEDLRVEQAECDWADTMTAAALLRRAQQIAIDHCDNVGLTGEVYKRTGTAFLLAKVVVELNRPIRLGERLHMRTVPTQGRRAVYNRMTVFTDEAGREAAVYDSRWILVDVNSRRILRKAPEEMGFLFDAPCERELELNIPRLEVGEGEKIRAGYSLCDVNRHINNTRYADLVCDALPAGLLTENRVRRLALVYHSEVPMGETFALAAAAGEDGYWYAAGEKDGKRCLEAGVWLEKL